MHSRSIHASDINSTGTRRLSSADATSVPHCRKHQSNTGWLPKRWMLPTRPSMLLANNDWQFFKLSEWPSTRIEAYQAHPTKKAGPWLQWMVFRHGWCFDINSIRQTYSLSISMLWQWISLSTSAQRPWLSSNWHLSFWSMLGMAAAHRDWTIPLELQAEAPKVFESGGNAGW